MSQSHRLGTPIIPSLTRGRTKQEQQTEQQQPNGDAKAPETPKTKTKKKSSSSSKKQSSKPQESATDGLPTDAVDDAADAANVDETIDQTLPAGHHEFEKDFAMQSLQGKGRMASSVIGEQNMKELEENRDNDEKQSLKIKISLDLDVEVHLSARIKGDITIGLL